MRGLPDKPCVQNLVGETLGTVLQIHVILPTNSLADSYLRLRPVLDSPRASFLFGAQLDVSVGVPNMFFPRCPACPRLHRPTGRPATTYRIVGSASTA